MQEMPKFVKWGTSGLDDIEAFLDFSIGGGIEEGVCGFFNIIFTSEFTLYFTRYLIDIQ